MKAIKKKSWYDFAGAWKGVSKEDAEDMKVKLEEYKKKSTKSLFKKLNS